MKDACQTLICGFCSCSSIDDFLAALLRFRSTSRIRVARSAFTNKNKCMKLKSVSHLLEVLNAIDSHQYYDHGGHDDFRCLDDFRPEQAALMVFQPWPIIFLTSFVNTHVVCPVDEQPNCTDCHPDCS